LALMYFLPAVIAYARASNSRGIILVLNLLLGWTVIGWWVLLVIAIVSPVRMQRGLRQA
jgi:TM2 domain-containing membrane protein YozV